MCLTSSWRNSEQPKDRMWSEVTRLLLWRQTPEAFQFKYIRCCHAGRYWKSGFVLCSVDLVHFQQQFDLRGRWAVFAVDLYVFTLALCCSFTRSRADFCAGVVGVKKVTPFLLVCMLQVPSWLTLKASLTCLHFVWWYLCLHEKRKNSSKLEVNSSFLLITNWILGQSCQKLVLLLY